MIGMMLGILLSLTSVQKFTGTAIALPTDNQYYDEATDTWYVLFEFSGARPYSQEHAAYIIKGYRFKEREGYLATIKDAQTHYMVTGSLPKMRLANTWIGLQIRCGNPVSYIWDDGADLTDQSFRAWAPDAAERSRQACRRGNRRLPIYYVKTDFGMRWQVADASASANYILVVFPNPDDVVTEEETDGQ